MTKRFQRIYLEISNVCNLQCSFCPPVERDKKIMPEDLFLKAIDQIKPLANEVCFHLMGDPLTHPKLTDYIRHCEHIKLPVTITTNGLLLNKERIEALLNPAVRQVNFSLHSFKDNYPDGNLQEYLVTLFDFINLAINKRPELYINFRLWNLNKDDCSTLHNEEILSLIENKYQLTITRNIDAAVQKSFNLLGRLYLHFDTRFDWPSLHLPVMGQIGRCHGLKSHIGIHADGTVVPCCLDKEAVINLGSINDQSLDAIIQADRASKIKDGFNQNRLIEDLCQRCDYIRRF